MPESAEPHSRTVLQQTETNLEQLLRASAAVEFDHKHLQTAVTWGRPRAEQFEELAQTYLHHRELAEFFDTRPPAGQKLGPPELGQNFAVAGS